MRTLIYALLITISLLTGTTAQTPDLTAMRAEIVRLFQAGHYTEALQRAEPMLAETARQHGARSEAMGRAHYFLASILTSLGDHGRAGSHFADAIALLGASLGPTHFDVAIAETVHAQSLIFQGRHSEAEALVKRAIESLEATPNVDRSVLARALNTLAVLYDQQERWGDAARLMMRVVPLLEADLGPSSQYVLAAVNNLAMLNHRFGRLADAEPLYRRAITGLEALGPDHESVAVALSNFALLLTDLGKHDEAAAHLERARTILERTFGARHQRVGLVLNNLAEVAERRGQPADAEAYYKRAIETFEKTMGAEHADHATAALNFAGFLLAAGRLVEAVEWYEKGSRIVSARQRRQGQTRVRIASDRAKSEAARASGALGNYIKAAFRHAGKSPRERDALAARAFEIAQWRQESDAAASIAQMAARQATGRGPLAELVRERQDLALAWQSLDTARSAALAEPPVNRKPDQERARTAEIARIDERLTELDRRLAAEFPEYASFANAGALSIKAAQKLLAPGEALVTMAITPAWNRLPAETFVWVVTRDRHRWVSIADLDSAALARDVQALRCGLDLGAWVDEGRERCLLLLGTDFDRDGYDRYFATSGRQGDLLPFDATRAHGLYRRLFGQVGDLIAGKSLIVVPAGALAQLPLQVLITAPPPRARDPMQPEFARLAWLGSRQPITVLPAAASLEALRRHARPSRADRPLVGFANPLLSGDAKRPWEATAAEKARAITGCATRPGGAVAALRGARRSVTPLAGTALASLDEVRALVPLPETADELCAVGNGLGADERDIHLGARATERSIKAMSAAGDLARYRVVHFATHATLAGELKSGHEPGLILTPPAEASDTDDGYLSGSEIALLRLDADWVILSACNTAGGNGENGDALSGLARAFFYAGARALLVSHWAVDSDATVTLIKKATAALQTTPHIGRAAALRLAMREMIAGSTRHRAHPAFWAPFVVVGEGAARGN